MSKRKIGLFALTLSPPKDKATPKKDVVRAKDSLLRALKRAAKKHGWNYTIYGCVANKHISESMAWQFRDFFSKKELHDMALKDTQEGQWHIHLCILAAPCITIRDFLTNHWTLSDDMQDKCYRRIYNLDGWLKYIDANKRQGKKSQWIIQGYPSQPHRLTRRAAIDALKDFDAHKEFYGQNFADFTIAKHGINADTQRETMRAAI